MDRLEQTIRLEVPGQPARGMAAAAGAALLILGLGSALAYLSQVLLARWMDPAGYGEFVFIAAWATVWASFAGLGLPLVALRFVAACRATHDEWQLRQFTTAAVQLTWVASLTLAALAAVSAFFISREFPPSFLGTLGGSQHLRP